MLKVNGYHTNLKTKRLITQSKRRPLETRIKAISQYLQSVKRVLNDFPNELPTQLLTTRGGYKLKNLSTSNQKKGLPSAPVHSLAVAIYGQFLFNMFIFTPLTLLLSFCYGPLGD